MVSAIYQESFSSFAHMETLLVKAANGDDYEFKLLEAYTEKTLIQGRYLGMQLSILELML